MMKKLTIFAMGMVLFILLAFTLGWAGSDTSRVKCLPEQPSELTAPGDEIKSMVGVRRNMVLLELATGTW